jgi:glycosyltransferase involved in cell wall biosynthesis
MRIAYVLPDVAISGGAAVVFQHANRLARRGHEVFVASLGRAEAASWFPDQSVPVVRRTDLTPDLDVLIATSWPTAYEIAAMPAKAKCYFVQADETTFYRPGSPLAHAALLSYLMDIHFLTMASWMQKWLNERFGKKADLIPNGVDTEVFYSSGRTDRDRKRPRILIEGAFALPSKGMKEAFEAVRDVDAEVWCVSSYGRPDSSFRYDRFLERVPAREMREVYSSCDILVKLTKSESFGLPPLEMMACGGVCVVSRVKGHEEYVKDGENGLMVAPGDVQGARAAVMRLIEDRVLRERLRANGLETAAARAWEPAIDLLETSLLEALRKETGNGPVADQVNGSLTFAYKKILAASLFEGGLQTIAHRVRKRVKSGILSRLGEKTYLHMKNHRRFYGKVFGDSL